MARPVIDYNKDLPEVVGRLPWTPPTTHLVKDESVPTGWREKEGRRPSNLLLVPKIRAAVDAWRESGYGGASEVTQRLFAYWFDEDHEVRGFPVPFRYYFCQREAIETLVWLTEIVEQTDTKALIRRFVPDVNVETIQGLRPSDLHRFAFGMATGSGKTWVMAMAVVWSRFHKLMVPGSRLSTNFLVVAPNVIVYQRLERDFRDNRIFHQLPLIPPEWRGQFSQNVILRGDAAEPIGTGDLFLTNIHQLYEEKRWTPANAADAMLGAKPSKELQNSTQRTILERVKSLRDLVVINDEAHHVHDEKLAWSESLRAVHDALPNGVSAWLDFSATPWDQHHAYFPWTVVDYPLAQAVEDRIVKAPLIVTMEADKDQPPEDPDGVTKDNVVEKYSYWVHAAVKQWKTHWRVYKRKLGVRPVLFIMAEGRPHADAIGEYLWRTREFGLKQSEVLVIHTDTTGEISKADLDAARAVARDIDNADSKIKAIVSVLMLREGWDVRNVSVVLGLRPFTAKAEILPQQVIGRGLRLMTGVSPDRTQTLEVLGTRNLLDVLRQQLEAEDVGVVSTDASPAPAVVIEPVRERFPHDIAVPITKPGLEHEVRKLADFDVHALDPIYDQHELDERHRVSLKLEFATTETEVHQVDFVGEQMQIRKILASIVDMINLKARLPNHFAKLYAIVREYIENRCFGRAVDIEDANVLSHLSLLAIREVIAKYLLRQIADLTLERQEMAFEKAAHRLSETKPFHWRRNLPPLRAEKTVFNYVATYNNFERQFAQFLDAAADILHFAALGTTEQGVAGTTFRVDYIKPSGAIGFYHPDWVAVQREMNGEIIKWVIETKGRVWEGTEEKDAAMHDWCESVTRATEDTWKYIRVNQAEFPDGFPATFRKLLFTVVGNAVRQKREASGATVTTEEILRWRDEGRRWQ